MFRETNSPVAKRESEKGKTSRIPENIHLYFEVSGSLESLLVVVQTPSVVVALG